MLTTLDKLEIFCIQVLLVDIMSNNYILPTATSDNEH